MSAKVTGIPNRKNKTDQPEHNAPPSAAAREMSEPGQSPPIPVELISELAYQKFLARGESHGSDVQDWLEAEREIAASHKKPTN